MNSKQTLTTLLNDHEIYHSDFQIAEFIINGDAHGNVYGMYKQALRELAKRKQTLRQNYIDAHRKLDELTHSKDDGLDVRELGFALEDFQCTIKHIEREFRQFFTHAVRLKELLGDITLERRRELDKGMWEHRAKHMAAMDLLTLGHFQEKTFNMISSFPDKERAELLHFTKDRAGIEEWYSKLPSLSETIDTVTTLEGISPREVIE